MKKVIYIAGSMRGLPESNYPQFENAARFLRSEGWDVCSPVEIGAAFGTEAELVANNAVMRQHSVRVVCMRRTVRHGYVIQLGFAAVSYRYYFFSFFNDSFFMICIHK